MDFVNCYEDANRANAYATLEFANTYYLAYRDLPAIPKTCSRSLALPILPAITVLFRATI